MQFYLFEEEYKNSIGPLVTQLVQIDKGEKITDYVPPIKELRKLNTLWHTWFESHQINYREQMKTLTLMNETEGNIKWHFHDE